MLGVAYLQYIVIVSGKKGFLRVFCLDPPLPGMSVYYVGSPLIDFVSPSPVCHLSVEHLPRLPLQ